MKKLTALVFGLGLGWGALGLATPAQVVIIRHAEKPEVGNQVDSQGCERAYSLPSFFLQNSTVLAYGRPVAIYAQAPDKSDGSLRPVETIAPTAAQLNMAVDTNYIHKDFQALANEVLSSAAYNGRTVFISWEHNGIPDLAIALGAPSSVPSQWPGDVFDQAWVLTYSGGQAPLKKHHGNPVAPTGVSASLTIIPEYVLPTDNPQGGASWTAGPQTPSSSSPQLSSDIQNACVNNDSLNNITREVASPALPDSVYSDEPTQ